MDSSASINKPTILGAVICGGKSIRFGSDKRLFKIGDQALLDIAVTKLEQMCNDVVCVFREHVPEAFQRYRIITDDMSVEGPMAGLLAALNYTQSEFVLCLPCDVPNVSLHVLARLMSHIEKDKVIVIQSESLADRLEPLIGIYPKSIYEELKLYSHRNDTSLRRFIDGLASSKKKILKASEWNISPSEFENYNRPKALQV